MSRIAILGGGGFPEDPLGAGSCSMRGNSTRNQRWMAASSRPRARRSGF